MEEQNINQNTTNNIITSKSTKNTALITGMIFCAILAIGGIAFGVYGMTQKSNNEQATNVSDSIAKENNNTQTTSISNADIERKNPIISATAPKIYNLSYESSIWSINDNDYYVRLGVQNGDISICSVYTRTIKWVEYDSIETHNFDKDCNGINGLSGKIYKIVDAGEGHDATSSNIAFIMEDGTVEYVPVVDFMEEIVNNGEATVKGTLKIDGFVIDALTVGVGEEGTLGGYSSTIFVLSDGSYIKYDTSMLN